MRKKSLKIVLTLAVVTLLFVLVALSVSAEGEQITIKYYQDSANYFLKSCESFPL